MGTFMRINPAEESYCTANLIRRNFPERSTEREHLKNKVKKDKASRIKEFNIHVFGVSREKRKQIWKT